jgi:hypothetical protein
MNRRSPGLWSGFSFVLSAYQGIEQSISLLTRPAFRYGGIIYPSSVPHIRHGSDHHSSHVRNRDSVCRFA